MPPPPRRPFYCEDLAYVHHAGFGDFSRTAAPGLLTLLREAGIHDGLILDLGCGTGIWAQALIEDGYSVVGIDASVPMLDIARSVAPTAEFVHASLHDVALPCCRAVTAIGEGISYLLVDTSSELSLTSLFQRISDALSPGGLFLFDTIVEGPPMNYRTWSSGQDWAALIDSSEDLSRRRVHRGIIVFREVDGSYRRSEEAHEVQIFSQSEIESALREAGFSIQVLHHYGEAKLAPRRLAFRAEKHR